MAFYANILVASCCIFTLLHPVQCQLQYPSVLPQECTTSGQYFNTANQLCTTCWSGALPTSDNLFCSCMPGYQKVVPSASEPFNCTACPSLHTSVDGRECVSCDPTIDTPAGNCICGANQAVVDRYSNGTLLSMTQCQTCSSNTLPSGTTGGCATCDTCGCLIISDDVCLPTAIPTIDTNQPTVVQNRAGAAYIGCTLDTNTGGHSNITACQVLANLCVLEDYSVVLTSTTATTACSLYGQSLQGNLIQNNPGWFENRPWLYYDSFTSLSAVGTFTQTTDANTILTSTAIPTAFNIKGTTNILDIVVFTYDEFGNFLGRQAATTGVLQLCPDRPSVKSAAFTFGTTYSSTCSLSVRVLSSNATYRTLFYELNLQYTDTAGVTQLFPVPVLITNYVSPDSQNVNTQASNARWVLVRRFFLVDNLSGTGTVRLPSTMTLNIRLQNPTGSGLIYPPYLSITYQTVDVPAADASDVQVTTNFAVMYSSDTTTQSEGLLISLLVFGISAVLYSMIETSTWRRRMGLQYIDLSSLGMFVFYSMANVANAFFIVMCGYASVTLLFYKGQSLVTTTLPDDNLLGNFTIFLSVAFAFKAIHVLGIVVIQSTVDIFFVDWERPKVKDAEGKVSIWRTYFIANEWNEIQTGRKVSFVFQLMAVLLFLEVVGFKDLALENPDTTLSGSNTPPTDQYVPVYNPVLRFALSSLIFLVVDALQVLYVIAIHERFISDRIREFIDLCSVSNTNHGYYIHGRSVYGKADTDMMDMSKMLQKEAESLTGARGLEAGSDDQTFEISITQNFRAQYNKIYHVLEATKNQPTARGVSSSETKMTENVQAYKKMKEFLAAFLDHSVQGMDYFVKDKMLLEKLFDVEMQEPIHGAFFYNDKGNSFTSILFYGQEFALLVFDILLFGVIDFSTQNYVLATILTYIIGKFIAIVRQSAGRNNLAKKTLVDKRFLI